MWTRRATSYTAGLILCPTFSVKLTILPVRSDLHAQFEHGAFVLVPESNVMDRMLEHVKKLFEESDSSEHQYTQGDKSRRAFRFINDFEQVGYFLGPRPPRL